MVGSNLRVTTKRLLSLQYISAKHNSITIQIIKIWSLCYKFWDPINYKNSTLKIFLEQVFLKIICNINKHTMENIDYLLENLFWKCFILEFF